MLWLAIDILKIMRICLNELFRLFGFSGGVLAAINLPVNYQSTLLYLNTRPQE